MVVTGPRTLTGASGLKGEEDTARGMIYVRWGHHYCPENTGALFVQVYFGQASWSYDAHKGGDRNPQ